jgi:hypothetical protein
MPYKRNQEAPGTGNSKLTEDARKELFGRSEMESDPDGNASSREGRSVHSNIPSPSGDSGAPGHGGADRHST